MDTTERGDEIPAESPTIADDSRTVTGVPATTIKAVSPAEIRDHELIRRIGQGSYGDVWLARNVMGTYRAVKIVYRAAFEHARPFGREFNGIQKFEPLSRSHDGFVDILQIGRTEEYFYYVMELADDVSAGQQIDPNRYEPKTLRGEVQGRKALPFEQCVELGLSLTQALGRLHEHALIHRDIKPSNIIFVNGIAKLADIGLVAEQSEAKSFVGTEGFIPPEGPGTPQADIYSLGKVLYEIATGKDRHEFPALPTLLGDAESDTHLLELNTVFLKACQSDIKQRYQTCEQMRDDLLLLQSGKSVKRAQAVERRLSILTRFGVLGSLAALFALIGFMYIDGLRKRAESGELAARRNLYVADMNLAEQALERNDLGQTLQLLERHRPLPRQQDLRGWEWRYLWRQSRSDELRTLGNHSNTVRAVAYSPDGLTLASCGADHRLILWDVESRTQIHVLGYSNGVQSLAFLPNGRLVVAQGSTIELREAADHYRASITIDQLAKVRSIALSADGRNMAAICAGLVQLWDTATMREGSQIEVKDALRAAFAPDNKTLAISKENGEIQLWDLESHSRTRTLAGINYRGGTEHAGHTGGLTFSPDGRLLASANFNDRVLVWDAQNGRELARFGNDGGWIGCVAFSPDSKLLATAGSDRRVKLWETSTWLERVSLRGHWDEIWTLAFSPLGQTLASAGRDESVKIWSTTPKPKQAVSRKFPEGRLDSWHCPGGGAIIDRYNDGTFVVWDASSLQATASAQIPIKDYSCACPSAEGKLIAFGTKHGQVTVWEPTTLKLVKTLTGGVSMVNSVIISPDGGRLASASEDQVIRIYDLRTGQEFDQFAGYVSDSLAMVFSSDGGLLAANRGEEGAIDLWDAVSKRKSVIQTDHKAPVYDAAFSPDSRTLATASLDATVKLWNLKDHRLVGTLRGERLAFYSVAFSRDGQRVAAGASDGTIRLWDFFTGQEVGRLIGERGLVYQLIFLKDGNTLYSGGDDGMHLWRAARFSQTVH